MVSICSHSDYRLLDNFAEYSVRRIRTNHCPIFYLLDSNRVLSLNLLNYMPIGLVICRPCNAASDNKTDMHIGNLNKQRDMSRNLDCPVTGSNRKKDGGHTKISDLMNDTPNLCVSNSQRNATNWFSIAAPNISQINYPTN